MTQRPEISTQFGGITTLMKHDARGVRIPDGSVPNPAAGQKSLGYGSIFAHLHQALRQGKGCADILDQGIARVVLQDRIA